MKLSPNIVCESLHIYATGWLHATAQMTATAATPLTMQQAVEMALRQNPTLLAAQRNLESIRAEEITARLRRNPVFSLSGTDITLPANNPSNPYSYAGNVSRLFESRARTSLAAGECARLYPSDREPVSRSGTANGAGCEKCFHQHAVGQRSIAIGRQQPDQLSQSCGFEQRSSASGAISQTDFDRIDLQLRQLRV